MALGQPPGSLPQRMNLVSFANSRWGPAAGIWLVRLLGPRLARRLAEGLADRIAQQSGSPAVAAALANSAVVLGRPIDHPEVQQTVQSIFRRATRSFVSLFEAMRRGPQGLAKASRFDDQLLDTARARLERGGGMLYVGCHTVGFDHLFLRMGSLEYPIQVLAYPETEGSYAVLNRIRREFGANLTPIDYRSLRQALTYLRQGGIVLTGVDRPDPRGQPLDFFGKKAVLPTGHARLALSTGAPIMVGATYEDEDGMYRGRMCALIESVDFIDHPNAEVALAQRVISEFEAFIRQRPDQWMMFYPVWPEANGRRSEGPTNEL